MCYLCDELNHANCFVYRLDSVKLITISCIETPKMYQDERMGHSTNLKQHLTHALRLRGNMTYTYPSPAYDIII